MEELQLPDWRSDRLFTGSTVGYPVELFIELIEQEANHHDEAKLCNDAWHLISSDNSFPTGVWKDCMKAKWKKLTWAEFKAELVIAFGHKGAYSLEQMFGLVQSLTKGETELYSTFLLRAEWVLNIISDYLKDKTMAHILFLLGISEMDQLFVLDKVKNCAKKSDDMTAIVALLDNYEDFSHQVKQEPLDVDDAVDGFECPIKEEVLTNANGTSGKRKASDPFDDVTGPAKKSTKAAKKKKITHMDDVQCDHCDKTFSSARLLTNHVQKSHKVKCILCMETFYWNDEANWEIHTKQHYEENLLCNLCPLKADDFPALKAHQDSAHSGKQTRCPTCKAPVKFKEFFHKCREFDASKATSVTAAKAGESARVRAKLKLYHLAPGEDPKSVKSMAGTLMAFDNKTTSFYCGFCYQKFDKDRQVKEHHEACHEGMRFQCDICLEFKAKKIVQMAQHQLMKHNIVMDTFQRYDCSVDGCDWKSISQWHMDNHHKMNHSSEFADSTTCKICGKRYGRNPNSLRKHIEAVHMNLKAFPCTLCPAGYASKIGLDAHMAEAHEGSGKFKVCCPLCGAEYRTDLNLHQHIANKHPEAGAQYLPAHMVNQRFECKDCGKVYTEKFEFNRHVKRFHVTDKWVTCHLCDHTSKTNAHFRSHFLAKHLKITLKGFTCNVCGNSYCRDKDCWVHIAMKHEGWPNDKSARDWKQLSKTKQELMTRRDVKKDEWEALKGHIDDKYLPTL